MQLGPRCHRRVAALAVVVGAAAAQQLGGVSAAAWVLVAAALGASKGRPWRRRARPSSALLAMVRWCSLLLLHPPCAASHCRSSARSPLRGSSGVSAQMVGRMAP